MALKSIAGNKLRAVLTMHGIIIGVMALVILVSLVSGTTTSVTDAVNSLGTNLLTVTISDNKNQPVRTDDLSTWTQEETIGQIAPSSEEEMTGKYDGNTGTLQVYGTTPSYYEIQGLNLIFDFYKGSGKNSFHRQSKRGTAWKNAG